MQSSHHGCHCISLAFLFKRHHNNSSGVEQHPISGGCVRRELSSAFSVAEIWVDLHRCNTFIIVRRNAIVFVRDGDVDKGCF
eukprot:1158214-Pelagomonas_calceolata.AAC.4